MNRFHRLHTAAPYSRILGLLAAVGPLWACASAATVELVADPAFTQGLIANDRAGKEQLLRWKDTQTPVWKTAQHHSKSSLADVRYLKLGDHGFTFQDDYQMLSVHPSDGESDLVLGVNAFREYAGVYRKPGGPWPHLYVEQRISNPRGHLGEASPNVSEMERLELQSCVRLLYDRPHTGPGFDRRLHAAQFLMFLTVQNLKRPSAGYGDYFWFGISFYDSRREVTTLHAMRDKGSPQKKGTDKFIYDVGLAPFTTAVVAERKWVVVRGDLLPHIRAGLHESWKQGYLAASTDPADYRIGSMVIGWEIPGLNDAALALKDLKLTAILKKATP